MAAEIDTLREVAVAVKDIAANVQMNVDKTTFWIGCFIFAVGTAFMWTSNRQVRGEINDLKKLLEPHIEANRLIGAVTALAKGEEISVSPKEAGSLRLNLTRVLLDDAS